MYPSLSEGKLDQSLICNKTGRIPLVRGGVHMKPQVDQVTLRRYLLGDLAAEDMDELEEMYLEDEDLFEQLSFVEEDLIDARVRNELSAEDQKKFDINYLTSPRRKEMLENGRAVAQYISRISVAKPEELAGDAEGTSLWQKLRVFILPGNLMMGAAMATSILLAIGGVWILYRLSHMQSQLDAQSIARASLEDRNKQLEQEMNRKTATLQQEFAQQQKENADLIDKLSESLKESSAAIISVMVSGSNMIARGDGEPEGRLVKIRPETRIVRLELVLDKQQHRTYQAVLTDEGNTPIGHPFTFGSVTKGKVRIPFTVNASRLTNGDHTILLNGKTNDGEYEAVRQYRVRVVRVNR